MGELKVPGRRALGRADAARGREFSDQRADAAARLHSRAGADQAGRRRRQRAARAARRRYSPAAIEARRAAGGRRRARRAVSDRCVSDRLGHQHQHERQRGDRASGRARRPRGASERSRQHGPEQQRCRFRPPFTSARRCCCASSCCRRWRIWQACIAGKETRARGSRQDRPHAPDGRDAGDARRRNCRAGARRSRTASRACAAVEPRLLRLAQGGTAVGTGINAHPEFGAAFCRELARADRHRASSRAAISSRRCRRRIRRSSCRASSRSWPSV